MAKDLKSFDLAPALAWYDQNIVPVTHELQDLWHSPISASLEITGTEHISITAGECVRVFNTFPHTAMAKSTLCGIECRPPLWFRHDMEPPEEITVTEDVNDALSDTAIVPGRTTYTWTDEEHSAKIILHGLDGVSEPVARAYTTYTLVHEIVHTMLASVWYEPDYEIARECVGEAEYMNGREFFIRFAELTADLPPVSHYSAGYRPYPVDADSTEFYRNVSEEICDTVAACILGFMFRREPEYCWSPLDDRPEVMDLIDFFLFSERV